MNHRPRILVCDDEPSARRGVVRALGKDRYEFREFSRGEQLLEELALRRAALVLLDLRMPGLDGMAVLERLRKIPSPPPVVVLTADSSLRSAIEAVRAGADDFLAKPYEVDELRHTVERVLERESLRRENALLSDQVRRLGGSGDILGRSPTMAEVFGTIEKVAPTEASVLITGETGTGKELAARAIHRASTVSAGPFVSVNCAAVPETLVESELFGHSKGAFTGAERDRMGRFEEADGGTLFLDEIGDMPMPVQAKLLRVLQDGVVEPLGGGPRREVRVRFLSATHRDLKRRVAEGQFREDLLFRIRVVELPLPPLRARGDDVLLLARWFLESFRPGARLDAESRQHLLAYSWPGNVRELRNAMERAAIFCEGDTLHPRHLPAEVRGQKEGPAPGSDPVWWNPEDDFQEAKARLVDTYERKRIRASLAASRGNVSAAARSLGIHRQSLQQKMKQHEIEADEYRDPRNESNQEGSGP